MRRISIAAVAAVLLLAPSEGIRAQTLLGARVTAGVGAGLAGPSSDLKAAPLLMGSVAVPVVPFVSVGMQVDYWQRTSVNALDIVGLASVHLLGTPLSVKAGVGYGRGHFETGDVNGFAALAGGECSIRSFPVGELELFANGSLTTQTGRHALLLAAGLALGL